MPRVLLLREYTGKDRITVPRGTEIEVNDRVAAYLYRVEGAVPAGTAVGDIMHQFQKRTRSGKNGGKK